MTLLHGGNIYHYSRKYGIPVSEILDFSASINPLGPSARALAAFKVSSRSLDSYPDPDASGLVEAISAYHGIDRPSILPGNGSTELIYLLPRALKPGRVIVLSPGFSDYERASRLAGCEILRIKPGEKKGFLPDTEKIASSLRRSDMLFLCNPNNPTGRLIGKESVLELAGAARKAGAIVVVDEAFIDYCPEESIIREAPGLGSVAVLRNFTKFFGMPGLRVGYLVAKPSLVMKLKASQEPWSVNTPAQDAAAASLSDKGYITKSLKLVDTERQYLHEALTAIDGIRTFPSAANFLLVRLERGPEGPALAEELASRGVLVRDCSNFRGLDGRFIRVAVRTRPENERLVELIKSSEYFTAR